MIFEDVLGLLTDREDKDGKKVELFGYYIKELPHIWVSATTLDVPMVSCSMCGGFEGHNVENLLLTMNKIHYVDKKDHCCLKHKAVSRMSTRFYSHTHGIIVQPSTIDKLIQFAVDYAILELQCDRYNTSFPSRKDN